MPEPRNIDRQRARVHRAARARRQRAIALGVLLALVAITAIAVAALDATRRDERSGTTRKSVEARLPRPGGPKTTSVGSAVTSAATTATKASRPPTITVAAVGDMIFDRRVKSLVASQGGTAPLSAVAPHLAAAQLTVGNLESPLSSGGTVNAAKDVTFRGDPRGVQGLSAAGFDLLSLANNHVLDYGPAALADTVRALDAHGIAHAGAGADRAAAWRPAIVHRGGATVAFLSFSQILPAGYIATGTHAGLAAGRSDRAAVLAAIRAARKQADYVIVSFHWGVEYQDDCNAEQVADARAAVDAGADMVLSHHPHVIQAVEYYKGRLIAYSLGDFVFDHYSRKTGESFVLDASLGPDGVTSARVSPVYLDSDGRPRFVKGSDALVILRRLRSISAKRATSVVIKGDTATVVR